MIFLLNHEIHNQGILIMKTRNCAWQICILYIILIFVIIVGQFCYKHIILKVTESSTDKHQIKARNKLQCLTANFSYFVNTIQPWGDQVALNKLSHCRKTPSFDQHFCH